MTLVFLASSSSMGATQQQQQPRWLAGTQQQPSALWPTQQQPSPSEATKQHPVGSSLAILGFDTPCNSVLNATAQDGESRSIEELLGMAAIFLAGGGIGQIRAMKNKQVRATDGGKTAL